MEKEQKQNNFNQKAFGFKLRRQQATAEKTEAIQKINQQLKNDCKAITEKYEELMRNEKQVLMDQAEAEIKAVTEQFNSTILAICKEEDESHVEFAAATNRWIKKGMMDSTDVCGVSPYSDERGEILGVRVRGLGLDFVIKLHDEFDGDEVKYDKAKDLSLPDEYMARLISFYRKDINSMMVELGGEPMKGWYWTSTPAEDVFGAGSVSNQLICSGTTGALHNYGRRIGTLQVRVALALK